MIDAPASKVPRWKRASLHRLGIVAALLLGTMYLIVKRNIPATVAPSGPPAVPDAGSSHAVASVGNPLISGKVSPRLTQTSAAPSELRLRLDQRTNPVIAFEDCTVAEALNFVRLRASNGGESGYAAIRATWVIKTPLDTKLPPMSGRNVPCSEVLQWIADSSGAELSIDETSVMISAPGFGIDPSPPDSSMIRACNEIIVRRPAIFGGTLDEAVAEIRKEAGDGAPPIFLEPGSRSNPGIVSGYDLNLTQLLRLLASGTDRKLEARENGFYLLPR